MRSGYILWIVVISTGGDPFPSMWGGLFPETEEAEEGEHTHLPSETRQRVQRSGGGENPIFLSLPAAGFGGAPNMAVGSTGNS